MEQQTTMVREVVVKYRGPRFAQRVGITQAADASGFIRKILPDNSREHFVSLYLDGGHTIVGYSVLTGLANSCQVSPREIFQPAILLGAIAVLVSHNHPSGKCLPSGEDDVVTNTLNSAAKILCLKFLDHVILGDSDSAYSYSEHGKL
jgi:DNA repair protein RadC